MGPTTVSQANSIFNNIFELNDDQILDSTINYAHFEKVDIL